MSLKTAIGSAVVVNQLGKLRADPRGYFPRLVKWARRLDISGVHKNIIDMIDRIMCDENNNWNRLVMRLVEETNPNFLERFLGSFIINAAFVSVQERQKQFKREGCRIPWAILMDPTAACNLKCAGCWAAEYPKTANMDLELLGRIISEGKQLGVYMYLYSGGEPLVRKADLLELARKNPDCFFMAFTNGTLVDEEFARECARLGNFTLGMSVEGFEEDTDMRRGKGTYRKVIEAMDLLKAHGVPFGFSACYHRLNTETVGSDAFVDLMVEKGAMFGWYFTYMPLGSDSRADLLVTPDQRAYMYHRVREMRDTKPIFLVDFWNDGEYVGGCVAGGRDYIHINAAGDVEPCAFIHYSNANIRDMSLLDALKQPIFREYQACQPFHENMLRPCPLLDNPEKLREIVARSGAHSTQLLDSEDVETLTAKTEEAARAWAPRAEALWTASHQNVAEPGRTEEKAARAM